MATVWRQFYLRHLCLLLVSGLGLLLLFHHTALDVWLADRWYDPQRGIWPLRDAWWTRTVVHQWLRYVLNLTALFCLWKAWALRRSTQARRWRLVAVASLVVPLLIGIGKRLSPMHCPWDIDRYGGVAPYADAYAALSAQLTPPGHCFPAGFVSAGSWLLAFALFFYPARPRASIAAGLLAVALSLFLGLIQQMRGAHFLSHVLWSLWLSWAIVLALHATLGLWRDPATANRPIT
ncbi:MAG TPA: phosphatase PAP2 family protein [Thermomonas sp.]|jgi:membrane-associated PAP2 superfamily phosphatase|uniref:phosphatase PAP2 family protein n=1 Tax=Thermomonas sp. TaxID=1971895 RepID=UPI002C0F3F07|nr:phosphatase PAP2 family protein [Thermomonas sp.]HOV96699.1 phosphatase PAP2 family protein [Thermomonas sp.]